MSAGPADVSEPRRRRAKRRLARTVEKYVVNRVMRAALRLGLAPSAYALLETTGRKTGRVRRIPVASGLDGDTFWLICPWAPRPLRPQHPRGPARADRAVRPRHPALAVGRGLPFARRRCPLAPAPVEPRQARLQARRASTARARDRPQDNQSRPRSALTPSNRPNTAPQQSGALPTFASPSARLRASPRSSLR
jgi:F420H(2)-dependent quinone reductase